MSTQEIKHITHIAKTIKNGNLPDYHSPNIIIGKSIEDLLIAGIIYKRILSV